MLSIAHAELLIFLQAEGSLLGIKSCHVTLEPGVPQQPSRPFNYGWQWVGFDPADTARPYIIVAGR